MPSSGAGAGGGHSPSAPIQPTRGASHAPARSSLRRFEPGLWLAPSLILVTAVIAYPLLELVRASITDFSRSGVARGLTGLGNYEQLFAERDLPAVLVRTVVWVISIVAFTTLVSLVLAQLLNLRFPGQRLVRLALIVPWAASIVVTTAIWKWLLNPFYGVVNQALLWLRIIDTPVNFIGDLDSSFPTLIVISVFLAIPFTVYVLLAGLQAIPDDLHEAARVDGASDLRRFRSIILPLLRPALVVATVLNIIYTFNSFTLIWVLTRGGPGSTTDISATYAYKLAFQSRSIGEAAALGVVNLLILMVATIAYVTYAARRDMV